MYAKFLATSPSLVKDSDNAHEWKLLFSRLTSDPNGGIRLDGVTSQNTEVLAVTAVRTRGEGATVQGESEHC
jgi:hypothetical protein